MFIQIVEYVLQGFCGCQPVIAFLVRHPLFDDQLFGSRFRIGGKCHTDIIKAFERADGSCPYGDNMSQVLHDPFDRAAAYGYIFGMHFVPFDRFAFDRFECSGSDMQCQLFTAETFGIQICQHFRGKMKPCRRCGNRTLDF